MSMDNVLWGAPRILNELALPGHTVAESTVAQYMVRHRPPDANQSWKTFPHNHLAETAACDFIVVPTITLQRLFCFVAMSLDRRRIMHINLRKQPTTEWTAKQLVEAFPGDQWMPRFLERDHDGIYGWAFRRKLEALGIEPLVSALRPPRQTPM